MPKIRTALSMLGSAKDAKKFAARFDDPSRNLPAQSLFPPEEVRPPVTDARTILLRVTNTPEGHGDIFAVVHTPVTRDSIAVLVFNPSIVIEAGATLRELVDHSGYPVAVAIVEEFLGTRIDHIVELTAEALTGVIDAVGPSLHTVAQRSPLPASTSSKARTAWTARRRASSPRLIPSTTPGRRARAISGPCCGRSSTRSTSASS